ncbi:hypothetical protein HYX10_03085 [Candidatus Woesearchaeota archaeon]|nr:hypothetical protein [Candidatus Woesearchaeota archaeon]
MTGLTETVKQSTWQLGPEVPLEAECLNCGDEMQRIGVYLIVEGEHRSAELPRVRGDYCMPCLDLPKTAPAMYFG